MSSARPVVLAGAVLAAAWLGACAARAVSPASSEGPLRVAAGEPFTLAPGERAVIQGLEVEVVFRGVESDSRCPRGVTCVWAGDAAVAVVVRAAGKDETAQLHTHLDPKNVTIGGARIELMGVTPYPSTEAKIEAKDYRATLRAEAAEGGGR